MAQYPLYKNLWDTLCCVYWTPLLIICRIKRFSLMVVYCLSILDLKYPHSLWPKKSLKQSKWNAHDSRTLTINFPFGPAGALLFFCPVDKNVWSMHPKRIFTFRISPFQLIVILIFYYFMFGLSFHFSNLHVGENIIEAEVNIIHFSFLQGHMLRCLNNCICQNVSNHSSRT